MHCLCGCGTPVSDGREFVRGHVVRYQARLRKVASNPDGLEGALARRELLQRGWPLEHPKTGKKFGVELEFFGISKRDAATLLTGQGVETRYMDYTHEVTPYWKIVDDGSVNGEANELVSPILRLPLEASKKPILTATSTLRDAGARIDRSCGHHVHHEAQGMDGPRIYQTVLHYCLFQHHIDSMLPPSRRSISSPEYCMAIDVEQVARWPMIWDLRGYAGNEPWELLHNRNVTVDLTPLTTYGTIQFRQHSGTLNGDKVWNWSRFTRLFMDIPKDGMKLVQKYGSLDSMRQEFTFTDMLDYLGADDSLTSWTLKRRESFTVVGADPENDESESVSDYEAEPEYWDDDNELYNGCDEANMRGDLPPPGIICIYCEDYCRGY